jgi:hypothetical protein
MVRKPINSSRVQLPYDLASYGHSLRHHGEPFQLNGWGAALLRRPIRDTPFYDAIGPWPYSTLPESGSVMVSLRNEMIKQGLISFLACARPDQDLDSVEWQTAGFQVIKIRHHFVFRPQLPPPTRSAKTRANLSKARRYWLIQTQKVSIRLLEQFSEWHAELNQRKDMSFFGRLPLAHILQLATLPDCHIVLAIDDHGPAAAVIVMIVKDQVHCHAQAGAKDAYTQRAFYALYETILEKWGGTHTIYLGGGPGGKDGPGVERFKRRFANDTIDVTMVRTILDPKTCEQIALTRGDPQWFPPYRCRRE